MSTLSSALNNALSGLRATQQGLDLVATNVANAKTEGYVRKSLSTLESTVSGESNGVKTTEITRQIDIYLQRQLRTETSGAAYASTKADYLDTLQTSFGTPGSALSLDTATQKLQSALDALAASPDDSAIRTTTLAKAQSFAQTLNATSSAVQALRTDADQHIASGVDQANQALGTIDTLTKQIVQARIQGSSATGLEDQRDLAIDTLSQFVDVRVEDRGGSGDIAIKTQSGFSLYEAGAVSKLSFQASAPVTAGATYPGALGGVLLTRGNAAPIDLLKTNNLRSGSLKALSEIRDQKGVEAQRQLDEMAANMAQALGGKTIAGTAVAGGVDLSTQNAQRGDRLTVSYTAGGATRTVTIVNVGDPTKLPLSDDATADAGDTVVGVDFSSPNAAADITSALAAKGVKIAASASATGFALTTTDASTTVTSGQSKITATALSGDGLSLPVFVDGDAGQVYSGSLDGKPQLTGFAGRIVVNQALLDDPAKLTSYATGTLAGDEKRPTFLRDALSSKQVFSAATGLAGASSSYSGSIAGFAAAAINYQASASSTAAGVADGQALVVSNLSDRYSKSSAVDVDTEMTNLITLQTAYGANARVITAVKEMLDMLMKL